MRQVVEIARVFLREDAGYSYAKIVSAKANEEEGKWYIVADVGTLIYIYKNVVIDDGDGNVLEYE